VGALAEVNMALAAFDTLFSEFDRMNRILELDNPETKKPARTGARTFGATAPDDDAETLITPLPGFKRDASVNREHLVGA
jgi:hypothetical protein